MTGTVPILYSFRRCPYAIRARLGLGYANIRYELREIVLRSKPAEMLALSAKATVPVLRLPDGEVIDESYDIIKWALDQNDPDGWQNFMPQTDPLVAENDGPFKLALDHYKYAPCFPGQPRKVYRDQARFFLEKIDRMLDRSLYLFGDHQTVADIALLPFIRQFAHVDRAGFEALPYRNLRRWLTRQLDSVQFKNIMSKTAEWHPGDSPIYVSNP